MAVCNPHLKCARRREKGISSDPCVAGKDCELRNSLSPKQLSVLSTPVYKITKEKRLVNRGW